jgi:hypothetical protein
MGVHNREIEEQQGLFNKYTLINNETGKAAEGEYFILKLTDPAALKALLTYADHTDNLLLANDLRDLVASKS